MCTSNKLRTTTILLIFGRIEANLSLGIVTTVVQYLPEVGE